MEKKLKLILIVLIMILVSCISFGGIYIQDKNSMKNILPEYILGTSLKGYREVGLEVNTQTAEVIKDAEGNIMESATEEEIAEKGYIKENVPINKEEVLTKENYQLAKEIIEKRLKEVGEESYEVRLDEETGNMVVHIKEDSKKELVLGLLATNGKFEVQDSETEEVLMDNNDLKGAQILYQNTTSGTRVFLQINFNKQGKQKLADISKQYIQTTDEEGNTTKKQIKMIVDDTTLITTYFSEPIENGQIQLSLGSATTNNDTLQEYIEQGISMKATLNNGAIPIEYTMETNQFIANNIPENLGKIVISIVGAIAIILVAYLVIRYHLKGVWMAILNITVIGTTLLLMRFTNVPLSIEGIISLGVVAILNYIFTIALLKKCKVAENEKVAFKEVAVRYLKVLIPVIILAIVFCFITDEMISNMGMVMFWGIISIIVENLLFAKSIIKK